MKRLSIPRFLAYCLLLVYIVSCGDEEETISARCVVSQTAGSVDLGFCMDFENVTEEGAKEVCSSVQAGTNEDGVTNTVGTYSENLCVISEGTEGCRRTEDSVIITTWFIGSGWPAGSNADKSICEDGGVPVTK